jgi:hypothetical protein
MRNALLGGSDMRCGYDASRGQCAVFAAVGIASRIRREVVPQLSANRAGTCNVDLQNLTACPPDPGDACAAANVSLTDVHALCRAVDPPLSAGFFDECVFDCCAMGADPICAAETGVCEQTNDEIVTNRPPAVPPPAPPPTPSTFLDFIDYCACVRVSAILSLVYQLSPTATRTHVQRVHTAHAQVRRALCCDMRRAPLRTCMASTCIDETLVTSHTIALFMLVPCARTSPADCNHCRGQASTSPARRLAESSVSPASRARMTARLNSFLQAGMSKHEAWAAVRAENDALAAEGGNMHT